MKCENTISDWIIRGLDGGLIGSTTKWSTVSNLLLQSLEKAIGKDSLLALVPAALTAFKAIDSYGIATPAVLEMLIAVYNSIGSPGLAQDVCLKLHVSKFPLPPTLHAGTCTEVLTSLSSALPRAIQQSATINDPNGKSCSTCSNNGTCSTYTSCGGSG
jgi:hypothetical protein